MYLSMVINTMNLYDILQYHCMFLKVQVKIVFILLPNAILHPFHYSLIIIIHYLMEEEIFNLQFHYLLYMLAMDHIQNYMNYFLLKVYIMVFLLKLNF